MPQIIVNVPDKKLQFFMELIESLGFSKSGNQAYEVDKRTDLQHVVKGLEEVKKIQSGELPKNNIEKLLRGV